MKAATGELSLTVITVVAIGIVAALFAALWPTIKSRIQGAWDETEENSRTGNVDDTWNPSFIVRDYNISIK